MQEKCTFESHAVNLHNKETKKLKFPARSWTAIPFCHQRCFISVNKPNSHVTLPVPFIALVVPFVPYIFMQTERMCESQWIRIGTSFGEKLYSRLQGAPHSIYTGLMDGWLGGGWGGSPQNLSLFRFRDINFRTTFLRPLWSFSHTSMLNIPFQCIVIKECWKFLHNLFITFEWSESWRCTATGRSFVCGYPINTAVIPETN